MAALKFRKLIAFDSLPFEWEIVDLALDWSGLPLLLMAEGKGPRPSLSASAETWHRWNWVTPTALHIVRLEGESVTATRITHGIGALALHVQPFEDGWIVGHVRNGQANLYSANGVLKRSLILGDAIEDVQTLPNGQIWVSYFDEGIYGHDEFSRNGLICFDPFGEPIFRFGQYAQENHLPWMDDCYALNVAMNGDVWVSYYSDFPLLLFRDLQLAQEWREFGYVGKGFAIRNDGVLYLSRTSTLMLQSFGATSDPIQVDCVDENGNSLAQTSAKYLRCAARGSNLILNTGTAIYSIAD